MLLSIWKNMFVHDKNSQPEINLEMTTLIKKTKFRRIIKIQVIYKGLPAV